MRPPQEEQTTSRTGGYAAGAVGGGFVAEEERRAAPSQQVPEDPAAAREQHFQKIRDMPYGTKEEQKAADKEAVAAMSGLSGSAGLGLGKSEAASKYRNQEFETQQNLDDPDVRALGGPGLGQGAKDAANKYRGPELDKQKAMSDPAPGTYDSVGLGSNLKNVGRDYSARELEKEKGYSRDEPQDTHRGAETVAGAGVATGAGAYALEEHEKKPLTESTAPGTSTVEPITGGTSGRRQSQTMYGLAAADAADQERYDDKKGGKNVGKSKHGKPGFFQRIFKKRKNEHTGEEEEYSSEEEHLGPHHDEPHHGKHDFPQGGTDFPSGTTTTASGKTFTKPTYNPLKNPEQVDSAGHY